MKKYLVWILIGLPILFVIVIIFSGSVKTLLSEGKVCPIAWYDNRMPGPGNYLGHSTYFVLNSRTSGEVNFFDRIWVLSFCGMVNPQVVE